MAFVGIPPDGLIANSFPCERPPRQVVTCKEMEVEVSPEIMERYGFHPGQEITEDEFHAVAAMAGLDRRIVPVSDGTAKPSPVTASYSAKADHYGYGLMEADGRQGFVRCTLLRRPMSDELFAVCVILIFGTLAALLSPCTIV